MTNYDRILNRGGFAAALAPHRMVLGLICLMSLALTGCPGPQQPGTDSGTPPDDGGMPPVDGWNPAHDSGMPPDDGGAACASSNADCGDSESSRVGCIPHNGGTVCAPRCAMLDDGSEIIGYCEDRFPGTWCTEATPVDRQPGRYCVPTDGICTDEMMRDRITPPCDPDTRTGAGTGPTGLEGYVGSGMRWFSPRSGCDTGMGPDAMSRIELYMLCGENTGIEPYRGIYYYDRDGLWYANYQNRATQEWSRMSFDLETGHDVATIELFHAGEDTPYQTVVAAR
jgi:hypothetical protein